MSRRNTDCSLWELIRFLENPCQRVYPRCLVVNEIGMISEGDGNDPMGAKKKLIELLQSGDQEDRYISIRYLKGLALIGQSNEEIETAIANFEANPANTNLLPTHQEVVHSMSR